MGDTCSKVTADAVEKQFRAAELTTHQLTIVNASLEPDSGIILGQLLEGSHLTRLNLAKNSLGDEGCAAIARPLPGNGALHRLVLSENSIGDGGAAALADALVSNRHLKDLDLYGNQITKVGAQSLARLLRYTHHLESLLLGSNQIGDSGVRILCNGCKRNHRSKLHKLGVSANGLTNVGAKKIWRLVEKYAHTLTTVEIGFNPGITDRLLIDIILADCAKNKEFTVAKAWKHDTKNRKNRKLFGTVDQLSNSQLSEFKGAFKMFDRDGSGAIEAAELQAVL